MKHPMQKIINTDGRLEFQPNKIIQWLFNTGKIDLNEVAAMGFCDYDTMQLNQLIGYSVSGYLGLSTTSKESIGIIDNMAETGESEEQARVRYLQETMTELKKNTKELAVLLFKIHPDDLGE